VPGPDLENTPFTDAAPELTPAFLAAADVEAGTAELPTAIRVLTMVGWLEHGPTLARAMPSLRRAYINDRQPIPFHDLHGWTSMSAGAFSAFYKYGLPKEVWDHLRGNVVRTVGQTTFYPSLYHAQEALAEAAVAWAQTAVFVANSKASAQRLLAESAAYAELSKAEVDGDLLHTTVPTLAVWLETGPALVREKPKLETVTIADRVPWTSSPTKPPQFFRWQCGFHWGDDRAVLPKAVYDYLDAGYEHVRNQRRYHSLPSAQADLAQAAVRWAQDHPPKEQKPMCVIHTTMDRWLERGPALIEAVPDLEAVVFTDKGPAQNGNSWLLYGSHRTSHHLGSKYVPDDIWSHLESNSMGSVAKPYPTTEAAQDALSKAAIAWAKANPVKSDSSMPGPQIEPHPIVPGGVYRHYKGGRYRVFRVALTEADKVPVVVYSPLDNPESVTWVRPVRDWLAPVAGGTSARYEFVGVD
jgi:hypothetical protein